MIDRVFYSIVLVLVAGIYFFVGSIFTNNQRESEAIDLRYSRDSTELYYQSTIDTNKIHLININTSVTHRPCKNIIDNILY